MIIDWHAHIYTPEEAAADRRTYDGKSGPSWGERGCPMVLENFLDAHHQAGIDLSVVTNAAHYLRGKAESEELPAVQHWNDYAAQVQEKYRGTLVCFATILPCAGPAFIKETERAVRQLGLKGIFIHSSHKGHYPDDDEARPFWELVQDLDVPVMIHPPHLGFGEERMRDYRLASSIGRPFDLCLALGRLIVRGVLEDFPRLKIVASHGGGGICETISRMDYAYELQDEAFFLGPYAPMRIRHPPSYYLTPRAIIARLHDDIAAIGNEPEFRKTRLTDIGIDPVFDSPEHLARYLEQQRANGGRLIRESGFAPR
jgi:predicted TIM-barrel fold metal-dependent hydrolase